ENRCALFLELLFVLAQFRTENRCALFLELLWRSHLPLSRRPLAASRRMAHPRCWILRRSPRRQTRPQTPSRRPRS
ncbi:hypothetical protein EN793_34330, partial [Mesorhizobium sp. M4B.F.Ca.ET.150.01.1.1]